MTTLKKIEDSLGSAGKAGHGEPGEFWADFKARAPMYPQVAPSRASHMPAGVLGWGFGAAAVALLVAVLTLPVFRSNQTKENTIHSLTVSPAYGAVFIVNDESSKATILWVDDSTGGGA